MKYIVAVVFGAGVFFTVCNASCMTISPKGRQARLGCFYEGQLYKLDSSWRTEDCMDCGCQLNGVISCCTAYGTPVSYDPETCNFVFNKKTCEYELMPNEDPTKKCEKYGMVG
ncbi:beta-microseminoprotein-like [Pseudophryne corroboree]|uniref:beta-microseminoprotein-like n=1 Tax=Pseudophryne corroboree TaxID=495146 RepID=UPI003081FA80